MGGCDLEGETLCRVVVLDLTKFHWCRVPSIPVSAPPYSLLRTDAKTSSSSLSWDENGSEEEQNKEEVKKV